MAFWIFLCHNTGMFSISDLNQYLLDCKEKLASGDGRFRVVMGNEAADLDSVVSSLVYAYFLHVDSADGATTFPIIDISRKDLKLKTEVIFVLDEVGLKSDNLIFSDDSSVASVIANAETQLVLVDHNVLAKRWFAGEKRLVEIIDHHVDEKKHLQSKKDIRTVGSCVSLIYEKLLAKYSEEMKDEAFLKMILGTVLMDTVNLSPQAEKATELDQRVVTDILGRTSLDRDEFFDQIQDEKSNVLSLSTTDLLRKDYKEWEVKHFKFGISSVPISIRAWQSNDADMFDRFFQHAKTRKLDALLVMTAYCGIDFSRELICFSRNQAMFEELINKLKSSKLKLRELEEVTLDIKEQECVACFLQENLTMSRKQIYPLVRDFFLKRR